METLGNTTAQPSQDAFANDPQQVLQQLAMEALDNSGV